jgi:hypothetical protein
LVWLVVGNEIVLLREALLAVGGVVGLRGGLLERTRLGRMLFIEGAAEPPPDLPSEFHDLPRPFDHREDAMAKRDRF